MRLTWLFSNRAAYTFIAFGILVLIATGVSALTPDPGHSASEVGSGTFADSGNYIFTGNVGIGTSTPQFDLDVAQDIRLGGVIRSSSGNVVVQLG